jgi:hypothetical protein
MSTQEAVPAGFDPNHAENFQEIEMQFAVKTVEHLEVSRQPASCMLCE